MYDKKAEKVFKPLLKDFIDWLTADYGEEGYDEEVAEEEEDTAAEQQNTKAETRVELAETEQQKAQRLLVEDQQRKLKDQLSGKSVAKDEPEERKELVAATEHKIDATAIDIEDEFDVDDI